MRKFIALPLLFLIVISALAADDKLSLSGRVKESVHKSDLIGARVLLFDSVGNVRDTVFANMGRMYNSGALDTISEFYLTIPRTDSIYVFEVECDGYQPQTITYKVENLGKRELYRRIPTIYLDRAPRMLNEVSVTTSKIKFYNKGDTVVYDADAFQLAEGSMLDALIAQLPGVELNNNGQIKVNGEFVESLLLNGKEFLDGNNNLMLENIAAYTVKNVQVYEGQTTRSRMMNDPTAPKVLTMDVRLKKEYSMGWIINGQGGYGTDNRYMGRMFASWFNTTTRVSLVGNVNNLNDNRKPGKNDTWTPEKMPSGTKEYRMGALDYSYEHPEGKKSASGNVQFEQSTSKTFSSTFQTNFLPGGGTYDKAFGDSRRRETGVRTAHSFYGGHRSLYYGLSLSGDYRNSKNTLSNLSGAFSSDQDGITAEILDALYSDGTDEQLAAVINRSRTRTDGWSRQLSGIIAPYISIQMPKSNDALTLEFGANYSSLKEHEWRDYDINYGADPAPAYLLRQFIDKTPNHSLGLNATASYRMMVKDLYLTMRYRFDFKDDVKDSYMYALDRLNDMGVYGVLPANYLDALDVASSYTSRVLQNKHTVMPALSYNKRFANKNMLCVWLRPELAFVHRHLDYWRNNSTYRLSKDNVTLNVSTIWDGMVEYRFGVSGGGYDQKIRNTVRYSYRIAPTLPDMVDMVDIVDDSDPLNIYYGNPGLRVANTHRHLFRWSYSPHSYQFNNILYVGLTHTDNALVRGYTYDTSTGVRYNRMYNVHGDRSFAVTNELNWQFGATKQFMLSSETDCSFSRNSDMIGVDKSEPELTEVNNRMMNQKLKLGWQIAGQNLQLRADYTNRHTTSSQPGFTTLDANHLTYGVSGVFNLPAGFGISTDFTCYMRRGYGMAALDTTDPIWNMRLTYCPPRNTRWVFTVDGFDLLHRLSNVNYAVSATGRTVSYVNTIPRYVMFSLQYRLNIQPKKR